MDLSWGLLLELIVDNITLILFFSLLWSSVLSQVKCAAVAKFLLIGFVIFVEDFWLNRKLDHFLNMYFDVLIGDQDS